MPAIDIPDPLPPAITPPRTVIACWLCTPVPGDEVPLRFRPWDAAPARAREDYYRG